MREDGSSRGSKLIGAVGACRTVEPITGTGGDVPSESCSRPDVGANERILACT